MYSRAVTGVTVRHLFYVSAAEYQREEGDRMIVVIWFRIGLEDPMETEREPRRLEEMEADDVFRIDVGPAKEAPACAALILSIAEQLSHRTTLFHFAVSFPFSLWDKEEKNLFAFRGTLCLPSGAALGWLDLIPEARMSARAALTADWFMFLNRLREERPPGICSGSNRGRRRSVQSHLLFRHPVMELVRDPLETVNDNPLYAFLTVDASSDSG